MEAPQAEAALGCLEGIECTFMKCSGIAAIKRNQTNVASDIILLADLAVPFFYTQCFSYGLYWYCFEAHQMCVHNYITTGLAKV